ncbi:hypothetical protein PO002_05065 [Cupriavidus necator]|uniref:hypothetical protein n=1 Tax=Cupriavidus necator TaxID=106590 RepID=UPI0039C08B3E
MASTSDKLQRVNARLESWGAWVSRGGQRNGYGPSCLTLEEIRTLPVRAYIPVSEPECELTHEALRKLPMDWYRLACLVYIRQMPVYLAASELGMGKDRAYRTQQLVLKGIDFLIKNPGLKNPPLHLLLKP